jgi:hypothetical protein
MKGFHLNKGDGRIYLESALNLALSTNKKFETIIKMHSSVDYISHAFCQI